MQFDTLKSKKNVTIIFELINCIICHRQIVKVHHRHFPSKNYNERKKISGKIEAQISDHYKCQNKSWRSRYTINTHTHTYTHTHRDEAITNQSINDRWLFTSMEIDGTLYNPQCITNVGTFKQASNNLNWKKENLVTTY